MGVLSDFIFSLLLGLSLLTITAVQCSVLGHYTRAVCSLRKCLECRYSERQHEVLEKV